MVNYLDVIQFYRNQFLHILYFYLFPFVLIFFITGVSVSQESNQNNTRVFTHQMTPDEELRKGEIGKDFISTNPPLGPVRNVAEFDKMQAVLIRYPFGISYQIIKEMAEDIQVVTIVANASQQATVLNAYISNQVNTANCSFLIAPSDSYWTRDYGPWFIFDGNGDPGIVDFPYNRPSRPNDDEIPVEVANYLGINLFGMDVIHTGGNYMTDGMGISSSSELVWEENPDLTPSQIDQMFQDYLGIDTYHVVPDPNNTYIDHIDCWGKFLDVDKVLIRSVPQTHPQYDEIEATAAYYAAQSSSYGTPYQVFRVYTPDDQPYTNSLILNRKVFVPVTGSQWDDDALQVYQDAMPGYEVIGFTGSWESTDALHCRAKGIADIGMLYIRHIPLTGNQPLQTEYPLQAEIMAYSDQAIYPDSVFIIYAVNFNSWDTVLMTNTTGNIYSGSIPGQAYGSQIAYYLYAADASGRNTTHPFIGSPDPHVFTAGEPDYPNIVANPSDFNITVPINGIVSKSLLIENTGGMTLNFNATLNYTAKNKSSLQVFPSASNYATGSTTSSAKTETSLVKGYPPDESGWMVFDVSAIPDGSVINSVEFHGYVNSTYYPFWNVNPLNSDPLTTESSALFADINAEANSGYYLYRSESSSYNTGWKTYMLGGNVNDDLQAALTQDWFAIGIMDRDNSSSYYIAFDGWNETNVPYLFIDYTYTPAFTWLTLNGSSSASGSIDAMGSQEITITFNAFGLGENIYTAEILLTSNDPDLPSITMPVTLNVTLHAEVNLKVYLEGPFSGSGMDTGLTGLTDFPMTQPYQDDPWNYPGEETLTNIPPDVVDWVLVEYRDAPDAASATQTTVIGRQAALLLANGSVVDLDGYSALLPDISVTDNLFIVIYHRNHVSVISANPLVMTGNIYSYDFTDDESKAFGGNEGHTEIAPGIWGMFAGDCNADGVIDELDMLDYWQFSAGLQGYLLSDLSFDGQVTNQDKNEFIIKNRMAESQVP